MDGQDPIIVSSDDRTRSWLILAGGLLVTAALVMGLIRWWPSGDDDPAAAIPTSTTVGGGEEVATTRAPGQGEPSQQTTVVGGPTTTQTTVPVDLFRAGFPTVLDQMLTAAGNPDQVIEIAVYDGYAFLAYRDPTQPGNIDRRQWRAGQVGEAEPNIIDDRVDDSTEPSLFSPGEIDPGLIARLAADAPSHYDIPTEVSHILIDRFLPFDERVLIRVYATPIDGRSGGGYVSYDTAGTLVNVCC